MNLKKTAPFLLLLLLSCSKTKQDEMTLFQKAELEYQKKNLKEAIELYNRFIQTYPKSSKSPEALFKLAQIYLNDLRIPKEAVRFFERICENYPDTKEAMHSLFMLGFIWANELHDYNKAKEYYQKFLEKYPNSELAISAKFELENLGKEPEKFLIGKQPDD